MPDQAGESAPVGLLLSDDMIFTSRITGTARALGITAKTIYNRLLRYRQSGLIGDAEVGEPEID